MLAITKFLIASMVFPAIGVLMTIAICTGRPLYWWLLGGVAIASPYILAWALVSTSKPKQKLRIVNYDPAQGEYEFELE